MRISRLFGLAATLAAAALLITSCTGPLTPGPRDQAAALVDEASRAVAGPSGLTTYEAEAGTYTGALVGPGTAYHTIQAEASGRQYVSLTSTGQYVQWTAGAAAKGLNVRYNMPDAAGGGGTTGTLSLYVNGTKVQSLALSSKFAWVYGGYPYSDNPSDGGPLHFFDDTHFLLSSTIPAGATVRLQKDSGDTASAYNIDLIDLEAVPAALTQPAGSVSITSYGAVANDGNDDTAAFNAAVNAAGSGGTVWIPSGTFVLASRPAAFPFNIKVQGAGMWYSVLSGVGASFTPNAKTIQFSDFAISGATTHRVDSALEAGIDAGGNGFGSGSVIQNVWFNHLKVGIWTGPMTNNLTVNNCRIWDTFADGINFYNGTTNSQVEFTSVRNTGDDGIAIWSGGGNACTNNNVHDNVVQLPTHANNIAVYGGSGNVVQNNVCSDTGQYGSGIYIAARFGEVPFSGTTTVSGNTLTRCGSYDPDYGFGDGAIRLEANDNNLAATFNFSGDTITNSTYAGLLFVGSGRITGATFTNETISASGTTGIEVRNNAQGSATVNSSTYGTVNNAAGSNFVLTINGTAPTQPDLVVTSVTWSPTSPSAGNGVTFSATIKNQGTTATPAGTKHRVGFTVDGTEVTWSDTDTASLAAGASITLTANAGSAGAAWTATAGNHTVTATVDTANLIAESNEANNSLGSALTVAGVTQSPDLVVTSLTWSPTSPAVGNGVAFTATIKNQGTAATPAGVIHGVVFTVDGTNVTWSDNDTASLAAGASITLTANGGTAGATWAATAGTHTVTATVDDLNRIAEGNETNNSLSSSLTVSGAASKPDLVVTALTWAPTSPAVGNGVTFTATIKNQGTAATPAGVKHGVAFFVDGTEVTWSDNNSSSLAAGASISLTANGGTAGAAWTATAGTHTVSATVDDQNLIAEGNETNNSLSSSLTVSGGTAKPDLVVTSFSWSPASPTSGKAVTFTATIKNQGTAATPSGVIHGVVFTVDGTNVTWSDNDTASLAAGASITLTANGGTAGATWAATSGSHSVTATVDDLNRIAEGNESNNSLSSTLTVP